MQEREQWYKNDQWKECYISVNVMLQRRDSGHVDLSSWPDNIIISDSFSLVETKTQLLFLRMKRRQKVWNRYLASCNEEYLFSTSSAPFLNIHFQMRSKSKNKSFPGIQGHLAWTGASSAFFGIWLPCQHVKLSTNASFYILGGSFTKLFGLVNICLKVTFIWSPLIHMLRQRLWNKKLVMSNYLLQLVFRFIDITLK